MKRGAIRDQSSPERRGAEVGTVERASTSRWRRRSAPCVGGRKRSRHFPMQCGRSGAAGRRPATRWLRCPTRSCDPDTMRNRGERPFCDQADCGQSFPLNMAGHRAALRFASPEIKSRRQMSAYRAVEQCAFGLAAAIGRGVGGRTDGGHAHPDRGIGMKVGPWSNAQTALGGARRWDGMMACGQTDPSGAKSMSTRAGEASTSRQASETASRRSAATDRGITRWRPCVA